MSVNTDSMIRNILDRVSRIGYVKPEDIPNIDLYMDQVTTFMEAQLAHSKRYEDDKILTKTMINNYAKNNLLPSPEKKRYSKEHLLVLIFIYYFKNILSISDIQTLLGPLTDKYFKAPVFVYDWPKDIKAFYMYQNEDGQTVGAVDLLVPGAGELMGGSQREVRYDRLLARMDELRISQESMWWYLNLRKFGTCDHAGFGMGFERLLIYVTGMENIRDVIPFHRTPGSCEY